MTAGAGYSYHSRQLYIQAALYSEAFSLTEAAKSQVADYFALNKVLPHDNDQAALPPSHAIYGTSVKRVSVVRDGVLVVEFTKDMDSDQLVFIPKIDDKTNEISWHCSSDSISQSILSKLRPTCTYTPETQVGVLMRAITDQNLELMSKQLSASVDLDTVVNGNTPLMLAARIGNASAVQLLLDAGAPVDHKLISAQRRTALMVAVNQDHADVAALLLSRGASIRRKDYSGRDALDYARQVDKRNGDERFELMLAAFDQPVTPLASALPATGAAIETAVERRQRLQVLHSKLRFAAGSCHVKRLITLLRENQSYSELDEIDGKLVAAHYVKPQCIAPLQTYVRNKPIWQDAVYAAMETSIEKCDSKSAEAVLRDNPDLALTRKRDGESLLVKTVHAGCPKMLNLFIRARDLDGKLHSDVIVSAIEQVPQRSLLKTVSVLIQAGADVDAENDLGMTPLSAAVALEQPVVAKYLIDAGADVNAVTKNGSYPLIEVAKKGYLHLVRELILRGVDVDATDGLGRTALHVAVAHGQKHAVAFLLEAGADRRRKDRNGIDAVVMAEIYGHESIHTALLKPTKP